MQAPSLQPAKGNDVRRNASYDVQMIKVSPSVLCSAHSFIQFPKSFTVHFNQADSPKSAPSRSSLWISMYFMFPGPTQLSIPRCMLISSSVCAQLTTETSYTSHCVKTRLTCN